MWRIIYYALSTNILFFLIDLQGNVFCNMCSLGHIFHIFFFIPIMNSHVDIKTKTDMRKWFNQPKRELQNSKSFQHYYIRKVIPLFYSQQKFCWVVENISLFSLCLRDVRGEERTYKKWWLLTQTKDISWS